MFEDDDYALRIKQEGYKLICAEDLFIYHHGMAAFEELGDKEYKKIFSENRRWFEEKCGKPWEPHEHRDRQSN